MTTHLDKTKFQMDNLIFDIYQEMPFLGYTLNSIRRVADKNIGRAAIVFPNTLVYNPEFFENELKKPDHQKSVLFHEVLHKALKHFVRMDDILANKFGQRYLILKDKVKDLNPKQKQEFQFYCKVGNLAMDCAIHEIIKKRYELPVDIEGGIVTREGLEKTYNITLLVSQHFEYYFNKLMEEIEKNNDGNGGEGDSNDHDAQMSSYGPGKDNDDGEEKTPMSEEQAQAEFDNILRKAAEKQKEYEANKGIGSSDSLFNIIPDFKIKVREPKDFWKNLVEYMFGDERVDEHEMTMSRPSRRIDDNPFGRKRIEKTKHVVFVVDTSASISGPIVQKFLGYINNSMKKQNLTCDLLLAHTDVSKEFRNLTSLPIKYFEKNGIHTGGTDLTCAQKWIMKNYEKQIRSITMVILTDGYTPWIAKVPFNQMAIYTKEHSKLKGITRFAVLDEN